MMTRAVRAALLAWAIAAPVMAETVTHLTYADLPGWAADDHAAALAVFRNTCGDLRDPDWSALCALAADVTDPRAFFELFFQPVLIADGQPPLITGYFEPELTGALTPDDRFRFPVYSLPPDMPQGQPWLTRQDIDTTQAARLAGLEIAWVDDAVDLFFMQVQGSGRIRLPDGRVIRVGYAGANGQPYTSVGQELVARGVYAPHQVSAEVIRNWVRRNPDAGQALLWVNRSYVFFRTVSQVPADQGPLGAMNRSVTPMRTIAVDPAFVPLGAPVWLEKGGVHPLARLMVAQDTGSAIRGAQRADVFYGTGSLAGRRAGLVRDDGRLVVLLPIQRAYALLPDTVSPATP